jgi:hypothetical protein
VRFSSPSRMLFHNLVKASNDCAQGGHPINNEGPSWILDRV